MSELRIAIAGDDSGQEARSLREWLLATDDIRTCARIEVETRPAAADDMGVGLLEVLKLVLDSGFSAGSLAVAIASWRQSRRARPTVILLRAGQQESVGDEPPEDTRARIDRMLDAG